MDEWKTHQAQDDLAAADPGPLATTDQLSTLYRYMRARARLESEIAEVEAGTAFMLGELRSRLENLDAIFAGPVSAIVQSMLTGKSRSVKTPWGVAGFRRQPARLVVTDEQAVIQAVDDGSLTPAAIQTVSTIRVVKAELDKLYERDGEVPPGCEVRDAEDKFYTRGRHERD